MGNENFEKYLFIGGAITQQVQDSIDEKSSKFIKTNEYSNTSDLYTAFATIPQMPKTLLLETEFIYILELA